MITFLTSLLGLAGKGILSHFESKQKIAEATVTSKIKRIENQQDADNNWDTTMAEGSMNSWKDEWFVLLFSIPLIMCFIPGLEDYVRAGFSALDTAPDWYKYALSIAVAASFGVRKAIGMFKK